MTGTFAGLTPVREIDGRPVRNPLETKAVWRGSGPLTRRIAKLYRDLCGREATRSLS